MTVEITRLATPMTFKMFMKHYDLTLQVRERPKSYNLPIFYASFKGVEIKDGPMLCSDFGNGDTPEQAIEEYSKVLNGKLLVQDAMGSARREFWAPNSWLKEAE